MSGGLELLSPSKYAHAMAMAASSSAAGVGPQGSRKRRAHDLYSPIPIEGGANSGTSDDGGAAGPDENAATWDIEAAMRNLAKRQRRQEALAAQQQQHIISGQFSAAAASSAVADSNNSNSSNSSFGASGQQQAPPPLRGAGENRSPQYVAALEKEIGDLRSSLSSSNSRGEEIVRQANAKCTELDSRATAAEAAVASHQAEITRLREEGEKVLGENRLLKRAVAIQSQRLSALESKVAEQEQSLSAAADAVRRLETENYALKHHLRQAEDALRGRFSGGPGSGAGFGDGVA